MKRRVPGVVIGMLVVVLACSVAGSAIAGKKKEKGKDLYKANCKVCHDKDSDSGEYTPMTLIVDQWERFFTKKYTKTHEGVAFPKSDKKVTEVISAEQLEAIKKFCIDHAADSEQPMTCG